MAFTCTFCEKPIQVGQPMLHDGEAVAHKDCIDRDLHPVSAVHVPIVTVEAKVGGSGFGNATASIGEPCLMPSTKVCVECQKPAISMCPHCKQYVHQDYGYNGPNCSGRHEGKCAGAKWSRELEPRETKVVSYQGSSRSMDLKPGNGVSSKHKKNGKGRR